MALQVASTFGDLDHAWALATSGEGISSISLGPLVAACEQRGCARDEARALSLLARGDLQAPVETARVMRLLSDGETQEDPSVLEWRAASTDQELLGRQLQRLTSVQLTATGEGGARDRSCEA
mmetsp:Transcript_4890/g.6301  ORF Transcript_4890/g.6301 Transcript_4890/m.6301 type:complete len:123 (-) Transcript_4890:80-448(-)